VQLVRQTKVFLIVAFVFPCCSSNIAGVVAYIQAIPYVASMRNEPYFDGTCLEK